MNKVIVRYAENEDCKDVYDWEFHPSTRVWMRNTKVVAFEEHEKWFSSALISENMKLLICSTLTDGKIAVVRVDRGQEFDDIEIGITIAPAMRGKMLSKPCLNSSIEFVVNNIWNCKKFVAEISKENLVSKRAFESAGFRLFKQSEEYLYLSKWL